jgi:hypothetical protein
MERCTVPEAIERKPNKFNEIFSTANNFLGPARGENPFVKKLNGKETPGAVQAPLEPVSSTRTDQS